MGKRMVTPNTFRYQSAITLDQRSRLNGHQPVVLWFTGLSGSGKSTIAHEVESRLVEAGHHVVVLDGDNLRQGLCGDLGFSSDDREENLRRVGEVSRLLLDSGVIVLAALVSPFSKDRARLREMMPEGQFIEVFCDCPLEVCEQRDVKGLYRRARAGELKQLTGVSSPYEKPEAPEMVLKTAEEPVCNTAEAVMALLKLRQVLTPEPAQVVDPLLDQPVFIVGAERSGTTVFRLMLDNHPEMSVCPEFEYTVDQLSDGEGWPDMDAYRGWLANNFPFMEVGLEVDPSLSYMELANSFIAQTMEKKASSHVVAAIVHRNFDQLPRLWSKGKYIHIVRDPRDVARSVIGMGWAGNVWYGVQRWVEVETMWNEMKQGLQEDQYLEVAQEQLILTPEKVLRRVCEFIGLDYNDAMLDYAKHSSYGKPDPSLVEQWRHKLTPQEVELVEAAAGDLMRQRGYVPVSDSTPPSPHRLASLRIHDKLKRMQYRIADLGLPLYTADFVSRRLRLKSMQEYLQPQLHEVWRANLK